MSVLSSIECPKDIKFIEVTIKSNKNKKWIN